MSRLSMNEITTFRWSFEEDIAHFRRAGYGAVGAALTLGVRGGGVLLSLLVLPLYVPVLIFGAGAVEADLTGLGATAHLSLLAAFLALAAFFGPWATTVALRIALE